MLREPEETCPIDRAHLGQRDIKRGSRGSGKVSILRKRAVQSVSGGFQARNGSRCGVNGSVDISEKGIIHLHRVTTLALSAHCIRPMGLSR
jgi:hypothetical protein